MYTPHHLTLTPSWANMAPVRLVLKQFRAMMAMEYSGAFRSRSNVCKLQ